MSIYGKLVFLIFVQFLLGFDLVNAQSLPPGRAISLTEIITITQNIGGFLIVFGRILIGIAVVVTGIMYLTAGSNPARVKLAKDTFKFAIIGALILFATGIIINTVRSLATDPLDFFR